MVLQTEFEFELPKGYVDKDGTLHTKGSMRLATAADEIMPMKDPRVKQNPAYLAIIVLSRVITRLGDVPMVSPKVIEDLFSADLAYLQDFYHRINRADNGHVKATCPKCEHCFEVATVPFAESQATH
jgi:hypothetical protein